MFSKIILVVLFIQYVACWPDLRLYTRKNPAQDFPLTVDNFQNSPYQANLDTVLLIHGFAANTDQDWIQNMKGNFLARDDLNVILVDWKEGAAAPNYIKARDNVDVGAQRLNQFIRSVKIDPKRIYCVGHSLGAHFCGLSGKGLIYKRITGMDPAGPLFKKDDPNGRLDKSDALFVDVINTSGCLGIQSSIGHKTFWPNGGSHQEGCLPDFGVCEFFADHALNHFTIAKSDIVACSHKRVYEYFNDSFKSGCNFKSTLCKSYDDFNKGHCKCDSESNCSSMGINANIGNTFGDFYLHTNKAEPFCQN